MRKLSKNAIINTIIVFCLVLQIFFLPGSAFAEEITTKSSAPVSQLTSASDTGTSQTAINTLSTIPDLSDSSNINQEVVVIYKQSSTMNVQSLFLTTNEVTGGEMVSDRVDVLELKNDINVDDFINHITANPNVLAAGKNRIIHVSSLTNDPYVIDGKAWQFENIGMDETWNQVSNSEPVGVAVLDTGVNVNHPDLVGRTIAGYDYVTGGTNVVDQDGHGTAVSGCIAATANNGIGISGVAGSANVKIAPYRVGSDNLSSAYICAALMAVADRSDIKVINMSYGGYEYDAAEAAAIAYAKDKGKVMVAAAGNEGDPSDPETGYEAGKLSYPASYDGVISVAATSSNNSRAYFSQYNNMVDLSAPGDDICTTYKTGYTLMSGTSFSSPIVAGACSVLLASNSSLSASSVESILENTALDLGTSGKDSYYGYGLIQLDKALAQASSSTSKPLTAISLSKSTLTLNPGNSEKLTVTYTPGDTTDNKTISWSSSNTAIAEVDQNGNVTAKSSGNSTITATVGSLKSQCSVTVSDQSTDVSIGYQTHVQNIGWQDWKYNGEESGSVGLGYRLEGIKISVDGVSKDLGVTYSTHIQNIGWQDWKYDGDLSGTTGKGLRLEAIAIALTGNDASQYDVYYRTHVQNVGWLGWAKNGENSGSAGYGYRLEGIQIVVVEKGTPFDTGGDAFKSKS